MACTVDISESEKANHFEGLLCDACKYLSVEQINTLVSPCSGLVDGIYWYSHHLMFDYHRKYHSENMLQSIPKPNEQEKLEILKELNRIGYDLIITEGSTELIRLNKN